MCNVRYKIVIAIQYMRLILTEIMCFRVIKDLCELTSDMVICLIRCFKIQ